MKAESLALGREVIEQEAAALRALAAGLGTEFSAAVQRIFALDRRGQLVVTGLGKSGLIARKIAATLSSTGTGAIFLHPVEGLHGDLGVVGSDDLLLAFSKSGRTEEIVRFAGHFKRIGGHLIAVCESRDSPLAELAEAVLLLPALAEAGPLALAPTTSTIMMLALGDALAMSLLKMRGLRAEDFAQYHPEGLLGRRLLMRASDLMHADEALPKVAARATFRELLVEMTGKHLGMACLVDDGGKLIGVFTDGDLRRLLERSDRPMSLSAMEAWKMTRRGKDEVPVPVSTVVPEALAVDCLEIMRTSQITSLVVAVDGVPRGILRMHDLVKAGLA